jgi:N-acetylmuramoyl-L-alanine amidase
MKRLLAVLLLLVPATALAKPVVSDVRMSGDVTQARIDVVLSGAPQFHVFYLADPYRIVIDMPEVDWRAAPVAREQEMLVTGLRHGMPKAGISRLVLDLAAPARIASADYLTGKGTSQTRLRINLEAVSGASFRQAMAQPSASTTTSIWQSANTKQQGQSSISASTTGQPAASQAATATGPKQPLRDPLISSFDQDLVQREQEASRDSNLGFTTPDGYFVTYMHPPGSLFGAGVNVGTQF